MTARGDLHEALTAAGRIAGATALIDANNRELVADIQTLADEQLAPDQAAILRHILQRVTAPA